MILFLGLKWFVDFNPNTFGAGMAAATCKDEICQEAAEYTALLLELALSKHLQNSDSSQMQPNERTTAVPLSVLQNIGRMDTSSSSLFWPRHESAEEKHHALCAMFVDQTVFQQ